MAPSATTKLGQPQQQPMYHCYKRTETLSTSLETNFSDDAASNSSSDDDTVERAYWDKLMRKATTADEDEVLSSMQGSCYSEDGDDGDLISSLEDLGGLLAQARSKISTATKHKVKVTVDDNKNQLRCDNKHVALDFEPTERAVMDDDGDEMIREVPSAAVGKPRASSGKQRSVQKLIQKHNNSSFRGEKQPKVTSKATTFGRKQPKTSNKKTPDSSASKGVSKAETRRKKASTDECVKKKKNPLITSSSLYSGSMPGTPEPVPYKTPNVALIPSSNHSAGFAHSETSVCAIPSTIDLQTPAYPLETDALMITDATQPIIYDALDDVWHDARLCRAADTVYELFDRHVGHSHNRTTVEQLVRCLQQYPDVAQVRFPDVYDDGRAVCFVLSYFSVTASLPAVQAAYRAFPEAIACPVSPTGLPLHYACRQLQFQCKPERKPMGFRGKSNSDAAAAAVTQMQQQHPLTAVIDFLLQHYEEATSQTNVVGDTPLHVACKAAANATTTTTVVAAATTAAIAKLLQVHPQAAQTKNEAGDTPLHICCRNAAAAESLAPLILKAAPRAVTAVTALTEKPLHLAVAHGCSLATIQLLVRHDPGAVRCLDDTFQTALHKAVTRYCQVPVKQYAVVGPVVQFLVRHYPAARDARDELNDTPLDVALCQLNPSRLKTILPLLELVGDQNTTKESRHPRQ